MTDSRFFAAAGVTFVSACLSTPPPAEVDASAATCASGFEGGSFDRTRPLTTDVIALAPANMHADALRIMQRRNIRRIPLVEDERVVGMVTLDDLLLDEAAPIDRLSLIVQAQIGDGGPVASDRSPSARRSTARAQATYARLLGMVRSRAGLASRPTALPARRPDAAKRRESGPTRGLPQGLWRVRTGRKAGHPKMAVRSAPKWRRRSRTLGTEAHETQTSLALDDPDVLRPEFGPTE